MNLGATGCYNNFDYGPKINPCRHHWDNEENDFWNEVCGRTNLVLKLGVSKATEMKGGVRRMLHKCITN